MERLLYDYFRSSAAYRVRIALNLKGIDAKQISINLKPGVDDQLSESYRKLNPQGRVPYYCEDDFHLGQSMAILEYLDECYPEHPLLPESSKDKAFVRQLSGIFSCDVHPLNNLSILKYLKKEFSADEEAINRWYSHWISEGFNAFEKLLLSKPEQSRFCYGDTPGMADLVLIPQIYNARRFNVELSAFPTLIAIDEECLKLEAFNKAIPENQPDA